MQINFAIHYMTDTLKIVFGIKNVIFFRAGFRQNGFFADFYF